MAHEPSRLKGNAESAMQLIRADALLGRTHQEDRLQPKVQRDMAGLEDRTDFDRKGLAAYVALVGAYAGALALHLADALRAVAVRAYSASGPYAGLNPFVGGFFAMKVGIGQYGHEGLAL
jgi:hypothetical protein